VVNVNVYAKLDPADGSLRFTHDWAFEGDPKKNPGDIHIPARKHDAGGTPIHFHLHDDTGLELTFNRRYPIWVARDRCPKEPSSDAQIPKSGIDANLKLLKILNLNSEKCDLGYNLRFLDKHGNKKGYDPMIRNGGTTSP
jgi:hypothetical protein